MFVLSHEFIQEERGLIFPFLVCLFSVTTQVGVSTVMVANLLLLTANIHSCIWANSNLQTLSGDVFLKKVGVSQPSGDENKNLQANRFQS